VCRGTYSNAAQAAFFFISSCVIGLPESFSHKDGYYIESRRLQQRKFALVAENLL
jgi:hypothetical protein